MLPTKHTKEGVLNEKLALKKLLTYITSVYKIPQKIKCLSDKRKRKSIPLFNIVMPVLLFLMLQYESFHTIFSAPESMSKRLRNVAAERWMWLVTALEQTAPEILWEMMNRRWDIEENGFHQLKTYYYAKHCYCHAAVEVIFNLMIIGFNMRELYLYRRIQKFARSRITRKSVSRIFRDDLLTEKVKQILYQKGG